jgi:hypothetical protein
MSKSQFLDWCETQHGLASHQVHTYRRAYGVAAESGLDLDELSALDTYKLTKLLPQVIEPAYKYKAKEHNKKWLKRAQEMTRAELAAAIAKAKGKESDAPKPKQYVFKVKEDSQAVDTALATIEKKSGLKGADAFVDLAMNFNAGVEKEPSLEALMKKAGPVETMQTFEKVFPDVNLKELV